MNSRIFIILLSAALFHGSAYTAWAQADPAAGKTNDHVKDKTFLETHSDALMILVLFFILVVTLIILVPQLLKAHLRKTEMLHQERLKALENGHALPQEDDRARVAGRTAMLVPMVVMICAGTVTCFQVAYRAEHVFTVSLAVWVVAGIVSLAAITGSVGLISRLAQIQTEEEQTHRDQHSEFRGQKPDARSQKDETS